MPSIRLRWVGILALAASLLAPTRAHARGDGLAPDLPPSLFVDCDGPLPPTMGPAGRPWPARSRGLRLTAPGVVVLEKLSANPELSAKLRVPGGRKGELVVDMRATLNDPRSGARTWVGSMPDGDGGELALSSRPRTGAGLVPLGAPGRAWHGALRSDSHGRFELLGIDGSDCFGFVRSLDEPPRCGNEPRRPNRHPFRRDWRRPDRILFPRQEPVDLLVITTSGAEVRVGGADALRVQVDNAVAQLNDALRKSGVPGSIRLVGCEGLVHPAPDPTGYDLEPLLDQLTSGQSEWAHEAHELRDARGADLVCLLAGGTSSDGIANALVNPAGDPEGAYCAVHVDYALSDYSFAHEVGHCLGCGHTSADPGGCVFSYSHGFYFIVPSGTTAVAGPYRTLMAEVDSAGSRPRVLRFSSPLVRYGGAAGPFIGDPDTADNARTVRATLPIVADYRPRVP